MRFNEKFLLAFSATYVIFSLFALVLAILGFSQAGDITVKIYEFSAPFIIGWACGTMYIKYIMEKND